MNKTASVLLGMVDANVAVWKWTRWWKVTIGTLGVTALGTMRVDGFPPAKEDAIDFAVNEVVAFMRVNGLFVIVIGQGDSMYIDLERARMEVLKQISMRQAMSKRWHTRTVRKDTGLMSWAEVIQRINASGSYGSADWGVNMIGDSRENLLKRVTLDMDVGLGHVVLGLRDMEGLDMDYKLETNRIQYISTLGPVAYIGFCTRYGKIVPSLGFSVVEQELFSDRVYAQS